VDDRSTVSRPPALSASEKKSLSVSDE